LDTRQGDPGLPPELAFMNFAPHRTHFGAAVPPAKRGLVLGEICHGFILIDCGKIEGLTIQAKTTQKN
jgi:hypothetical protein